LKYAVNFQTFVERCEHYWQTGQVVLMWGSALWPWKLGKCIGNWAAERGSELEHWSVSWYPWLGGTNGYHGAKVVGSW